MSSNFCLAILCHLFPFLPFQTGVSFFHLPFAQSVKLYGRQTLQLFVVVLCRYSARMWYTSDCLGCDGRCKKPVVQPPYSWNINNKAILGMLPRILTYHIHFPFQTPSFQWGPPHTTTGDTPGFWLMPWWRSHNAKPSMMPLAPVTRPGYHRRIQMGWLRLQ